MNATLKIENILFGNRDNAERVLREMRHIANVYGFVSVADLYDLIDHSTAYTDTQYVWLPHSLKNVYVSKVPNGYTFYLPPASFIGSEKPAVTYRDYSSQKTASKLSPKSLTIAIDSNVDDLDGVLANVFKYVYTIADREVVIDIT